MSVLLPSAMMIVGSGLLMIIRFSVMRLAHVARRPTGRGCP